MSILRPLLLLLVALALLLSGFLLYLHYGDLSRHRATLESTLSKALDRPLTISGELQLRLWPTLNLEVGDVAMANPDWSTEPRMMALDRLALDLAPYSVLFGPLQVNKFELSGLTLLLESDAEGHTNWQFGGTAADQTPPPPASSDGLPLLIKSARLHAIAVTLRQPLQPDRSLRLQQLLLQSEDKDLLLSSKGDVGGLPLDLSGRLGSLQPTPRTSPIQLQLEGTLGRLRLDVSAQVDDLETLSGASVDASIAVEDISEVLSAVDLQLPLQGPAQITARLEPVGPGLQLNARATVSGVKSRAKIALNGEQFALQASLGPLQTVGELLELPGLPDMPLEVSSTFTPGQESIVLEQLIAVIGNVKLEATGTVARNTLAAQLQLKSSGPSLANIHSELPDVPFDSALALALQPDRMNLSDMVMRLGNSDLAGSLSVGLGAVPMIKADLKSTRLDLDQLLTPKATQAAPQAPAPVNDSKGAPARYVFAEDPLPFASLRQTAIEARVEIDRITQRDLAVTDVSLSASARSGLIAIALHASGPHNGLVAGRLNLDASDDIARLQLDIALRDMRLDILSGPELPRDQIPPTSVSLQLDASGSSQRQMAAGANGAILITQGAGKIQNNLIGAGGGDILSQLFTALNPFATKEKYSQFDCSLVVVNIDRGLAQLEQLLLQGQKAVTGGAGQIDLRDESLQLHFTTKPREGIGVSANSFVTPFVALKGTLAKPQLGMNEKSTLLTAGAAAATGGLSLLVKAAADRASAGVDHCSKTLPLYPHPSYQG